MFSVRFLAAFTLFSFVYHSSLLFAHTSTIALTGNAADGIAQATWGNFTTVQLNNAGAVAFAGTLQHENDIGANNDVGIWLRETTANSLLAQTGSGNVPEVVDADFGEFSNLSLSETGDVAVRSTLETGAGGVTSANQLGLWLLGTNDNHLLARTGSGDVAGVPNANFMGFPTTSVDAPFALSSNGTVAVFGGMEVGTGGVFSTTDFGLWSFSTTDAAMLAREGSLNVPDVLGANFKNFLLPSINSNNQVASLALLHTGGSVTGATQLGIWRYDDTVGQLLARSGVGNVPGLAGVNFTGFGSPLINDAGQTAFRANVSNGTDGLWRFTENVGELIASSNSSVPNVSDAVFAEFGLISLNESGQLLTLAALESGVGGVTNADDQGLWLMGGDDHLVARTGSGQVPQVADANFASFLTSALNENGQVAFAAKLEIGPGEVDVTNDSGIWLVDPAGDSWLVAREGDLLAGRTIASLDFAGDAVGQSNGFNDSGEVAFQASFTNGDMGVFLFRPYAADFDRDGEVDLQDLAGWQASFPSSSGADADADGDSDGADFLVWQREFGSGASIQPIVSEVPEPSSIVLLLASACVMCRRN